MLEAVPEPQLERRIRIMRGEQEVWSQAVDEDANVTWDAARESLRISDGGGQNEGVNSIEVFSLSIPSRPAGQAQHGLVELLGKIMDANVKLRTISGFFSGQTIKIFCVPANAEEFRAFAKSTGLAVTEGSGSSFNEQDDLGQVLAYLQKVALSGSNLSAFEAFDISGKAAGFIHLG
jgi:hypothetical protein